MLTASMPFPAKGRRPHRVEGYLQLLRLVATKPVIDREPRLFSGAEEIDQASIELSRHGITGPDSYIAIAVGAAQPNKMWMPERFAELVRRLSADGLRVVLVGSPAEKSLSEQVIGQSGGGVVNLAGSGSLSFTAEIIRRATAFVGNDSGLAHVAAAVKTRAVILSGPGDPTEVAPYNTNAATIAKQLFCKPCYKNYCWRKDKPLECLELIGVEEVHKAVIAGI